MKGIGVNFSKTIIITVLLYGVSLTANAGLMCTAATAMKVSNTSECELGSTNNDKLNPPQVNEDSMFGYTDWIFAEKEFDADEDIDIGLSTQGGSIMGMWSIDDIWSMYSDVMLVFKSGNGNVNIDTYVGYLLDTDATSGAYMTPHANANNGNPKNISHISAYVRGNGNQIPEPGILALFGAGLLGFGLARRKKRST